MFSYAVLKDKIVTGVQQSSAPIENPDFILIDNYDVELIGKKYYYKKFVDVAQPVEAIRDITKGAFFGRFTLEEAIALETSTDPVVKVLDKRLNLRSHVNLDFPELIEGLNYMVSKGILTAARATELRADGAEDEAFTGR